MDGSLVSIFGKNSLIIGGGLIIKFMKKLYFILGILIIIGVSIFMMTKREQLNTALQDFDGEYEIATFAGGCFWCVEAAYEEYDGVIKAVSGYAGGDKDNAQYEKVAAGQTDHYESVQIYYDPKRITYNDLLEVFWRQIDPTDAEGSFVDRGPQYRSAIFYHDDMQKMMADASQAKLEQLGMYDKPIVTEILPFREFFIAEEYHQDYYKKNKLHYKTYRFGSGRDQYRKEVWGDDRDYKVEPPIPTKEELKESLTPLQYHVTQNNGTERAFQNEYWDNKEEGIYVDIISGEPLFSSKHKFESGTGWPSFTQPIRDGEVILKEDRSYGMIRTEVRSKDADSHLGHVFNDAPKELGGIRYCLNSASLKFIPKENLEEKGYGEFLKDFE